MPFDGNEVTYAVGNVLSNYLFSDMRVRSSITNLDMPVQPVEFKIKPDGNTLNFEFDIPNILDIGDADVIKEASKRLHALHSDAVFNIDLPKHNPNTQIADQLHKILNKHPELAGVKEKYYFVDNESFNGVYNGWDDKGEKGRISEENNIINFTFNLPRHDKSINGEKVKHAIENHKGEILEYLKFRLNALDKKDTTAELDQSIANNLDFVVEDNAYGENYTNVSIKIGIPKANPEPGKTSAEDLLDGTDIGKLGLHKIRSVINDALVEHGGAELFGLVADVHDAHSHLHKDLHDIAARDPEVKQLLHDVAEVNRQAQRNKADHNKDHSSQVAKISAKVAFDELHGKNKFVVSFDAHSGKSITDITKAIAQAMHPDAIKKRQQAHAASHMAHAAQHQHQSHPHPHAANINTGIANDVPAANIDGASAQVQSPLMANAATGISQ